MALGDSYPVELLDDQGNRVATEVAAVQFTDGADQPSRSNGGSLPEGWTQSGSPANVETHGGSLSTGAAGGISIGNDDPPDPATLSLTEPAGDGIVTATGAEGVQSFPTGTTAYAASGANGATVALDAGGLAIINLPAADPHIAGALWDDGGTPAISTG